MFPVYMAALVGSYRLFVILQMHCYEGNIDCAGQTESL